jgi:RNA polymerase sigma-70 factor (ECF subfamily)
MRRSKQRAQRSVLRPSCDSSGAPAAPQAKGGQRSTRWSVIVRAQGSGPAAERALGELIRRYDRTVLAIVRGFGHPRDVSPEDLKQEFFEGMLRRDDIRKLDRERGKFRNWLHVAVKNFLKNEWEKWHAERRGNRVTTPACFEVQHDATPEHSFMRQFAEDTLLCAVNRHREETHDKARFALMVRFLPGPELDLGELAPVAAALRMPPGRLAVKIHLMREKHKRILWEVVADTLDLDPGDSQSAEAVRLEMGCLYRFLCDAPATHVVLEDA